MLATRSGDEPFVLEGQRIRVTTSIGLAALGDEQLSAGEVLARADQAMYQAKDAGRDRLAEYSAAEREEIEAGRTWSERVRDALEHERFVLHCQPIIDLADRRAVPVRAAAADAGHGPAS